MKRSSGILLHVSSLPSSYGIGTFGREAYSFVDFLKKAKQQYWQILPLCPTSFGDSPYQSPSAFALNPYFIDPELLEKAGLLEKEDYKDLDFGENLHSVDYNKVYVNIEVLMRKAFARRELISAEEFDLFLQKQNFWIGDYALYMALKNHFGGQPWEHWDEDIKHRTSDALRHYQELYHEEIEYFQFVQYIVYMQWFSLKNYANRQGIQIIGDIPIYASADSADTWSYASSGIFQFTKDLTPISVAGCPPDYFSEDGQYWGNTLYDWKKNRETGYEWWLQRIRSALTTYDWVRIDHFRGFESYWEVPYGSPSAAYGNWKSGPGIDFINTMKQDLEKESSSGLNIIAEDLGYMTEQVREFVKQSGFPGMKVLGFAFDSASDNDHLPHNYHENTIAYTGTHDNDTILGWFAQADTEQQDFAKKYLKLDEEEGYNWGFIRGIMSSVSVLAITPMQDYLGLGSAARMNTPSTLGGSNWRWRMEAGAASEELAEKIAELTHRYSRD